MNYVAVDLGASYVRAASGRDGRLDPIVRRRVAELPRAPEAGIGDAVVDTIREATAGRAPTAVGIGVATLVDDQGSLQRSLEFGVPGGSYLRDRLVDEFSVPVAVDNDANMAALGEYAHGAGRGCRVFAVLTLGTYLGMGIVIDGEVFRGARGGAGEVGELLVPAGDITDTAPGRAGRPVDTGPFGTGRTTGPDGYAWIEQIVGGAALAQSSETAAGSGPGERRRVLQEAAAGDPNAHAAALRAVEGWAYTIAAAATMLDPDAIALSGGLSNDLGSYLEMLRDRVADLARTPPDIVLAELGEHAGLIGAQVAASRLLAD